MNTLEIMRTRLYPLSEEERQIIRDELADVLKTPHFTNSERYPAFLTYTVEKAIEGDGADLKERTLGVEVFHRRPDYDTNSDTVVRFVAGEVRKRLALVYHESDFQHKVQIVLPTGSYLPEFFRVHTPESAPTPATAGGRQGQDVPPSEPEGQDDAPHSLPVPDILARTRWHLAAAFATLTLIVAGLLFWVVHVRSTEHQSSLVRFWQPIRAIPTPALISTGANVFPLSTDLASQVGKPDDYSYISMADARALIDIVDSLARSQTGYIVKATSSTTLTDLREHPAILLGAYNNQWTVRLLSELRFRFAPRPALQIYDSANPSRIWERPAGVPYKDADDFAIVARFRDKLTDNMVIVVAGIGKNGTEAASQFILTPRYLDQLNSQSKDWASRNFEVVLKTSVVDGKTGAPSIEAMYVW
jgi:hypothetical protein